MQVPTASSGNGLRTGSFEDSLEDNTDSMRKTETRGLYPHDRQMLPESRITVCDLPDDVLLEILQTAYGHHFPDCHLVKYDPLAHLPIAFSQVCQRFRAIALSVAGVWACVHVTPRSIRYNDMNLALQLSRARGHPLSVTFLCHCTEPGPGEPPVESESDFRLPTSWLDDEFLEGPHFMRYKKSWNLLLAHADRWRHCVFYAQNILVLGIFFNDDVFSDEEGRLSMPLLEFADLAINEDEDVGWGPWLLRTHLDAPGLKQLRMHCVTGFPAPLPGMTPPPMLTKLTYLVLRCPWSLKYTELSNTLNALGATLTTLVLDDIHIDAPEMELTLQLPHLRHLVLGTVCFFNRYAWKPILAPFSTGAPSLTWFERVSRPTLAYNWRGHLPDEEAAVLEARNPVVQFPAVRTLRLNWGLMEAMLEDPSADPFPVVRHIYIDGLERDRLEEELEFEEDPEFPVEDARYLWPRVEQADLLELSPARRARFLAHRWPELEKLTLASVVEPDLLLRFIRRRAKSNHIIKELFFDETLELDPQLLFQLRAEVPVIRFGKVAMYTRYKYWNPETETPTAALRDFADMLD